MAGLGDWVRAVLWPAPKVKPQDLVEYEAARARLDTVTTKIDEAVAGDDKFGDMVKGMQDRRVSPAPVAKKQKRR